MEEFRLCPNCGYERGFHVFLKKVKGKIKIGLICPHCGSSYDLGWLATNIKGLKPERGLIY